MTVLGLQWYCAFAYLLCQSPCSPSVQVHSYISKHQYGFPISLGFPFFHIFPNDPFFKRYVFFFLGEGPRVHSVLDYPPPHPGPLFWFLSKDPCMESANQYLSPEPCFARNGCINFEIQGSKLCWTIRPLTLGHSFGFFQRTHVWKAPTSTFHQSPVLPGMVASFSRSKGRKCAGLSAL